MCDDTLRHVSDFLGHLEFRVFLFGLDRDLRQRVFGLNPPIFVAHPRVGVTLKTHAPPTAAPSPDSLAHQLPLVARSWRVWPAVNMIAADYVGICPHDGCDRMTIVIPESTSAHYEIVVACVSVLRYGVTVVSATHVQHASTYAVSEPSTNLRGEYVPRAGDRIGVGLHLRDLTTLPRSTAGRRPPAVNLRIS